jgi:hypothetical protein
VEFQLFPEAGIIDLEIFHEVVRNTMDIDILVHDEEFQKATEVSCTLDSCSKLKEIRI